MHEEERRRVTRGLIALGLGASPFVGGAVVFAVLWRLRRKQKHPHQPSPDEADLEGDEVGEEAAKSDIDDPWPAASKRKPGSSRGQEDEVEHLSTVLLDETLPVGARDLWRLVMADPEFFDSVQKLNKHRATKQGRWKLTKDGGAERRVMYITPIKKQLVGPKEAQCRETHHCTGPPDSSWQVDVRVQTPKVPYGNSFHSHLRWAARSIDDKHTHLKITCQVVFTGSCMMKGVVKKASIEGMKESYTKYRAHLLQRLKVGGVAPPRAEQQGNGGRQAQQLLLLLLLGALLIITYLALAEKQDGERNMAAHVLHRGRALAAAAFAGLRRSAAGAAAAAAASLQALQRQSAQIAGVPS
ncbi:probable membrane-anchored lipid-binding protein YSP2 at C-terminar half [Coccomyxa sp. Obi]|nr:probable membrane-anchored lipid-binding protein YSP2 at C-terminar half [Coccomyxa sp. Obi]